MYLASLALVSALGCRGEDLSAPTPVRDATQLFWALTLDHHAVTLSSVAPHDTIRLTATPRTATGEPLTGLPAPVFSTSDADRVQVSADGLVRARQPGRMIQVVAVLSAGNVTHTDTVLVTVTDTSSIPQLASLSIHPIPPDSAKLSVYGLADGAFFGGPLSKRLSARFTDASGNSIPDIIAYYTSSDPTVAMIGRTSGAVTPVRPGAVTITATATAYGVTRADTLPFIIGLPLGGEVEIAARRSIDGGSSNGFDPDTIVIATGGYIVWYNRTGAPTDVTFDDSTGVRAAEQTCTPLYTFLAPFLCEDGDIAAFAQVDDPDDPLGSFLSNMRLRSFSTPGTYSYRSTRFGTSGVIIVVDDAPSAGSPGQDLRFGSPSHSTPVR